MMMRKTVFALVVALAMVGCKKKASDKEVKEATNNVVAIHEGYFKVIEDNKADPKKAIEEGEKYVKANRAKLEAVAKVFDKEGTKEHVKMVEEMQTKVNELMAEKAEALGPAFGKHQDLIPVMRKQLETMDGYYKDKSSGGGDTKVPAGARKQQKEMILEMAMNFKDTAKADRDKMLDQWVKTIAESGGDKAEQDAFREELKKKLGW